MSTLSLVVGTGSDDARQAGTTMTLGGGANILSGATNRAGVRFTGVALVASDTIDSASLILEVMATANDDPNGVVWRGELATNPGTFTTTNNDITSRATTTANVTWSGTGVGTGDKTINVKTIVEELIAQGGWASGNAMVFVGYAVAGTDVRFTNYETSTTTCPRLEIVYTPAAGGGAMPKTARVRLSTKVGGLLTA